MTNDLPFTDPNRIRWFEDYEPGATHHIGSTQVDEDEVVAFAKRYDPQSMHTDKEAAEKGHFGGLIASGWHTAGMMMAIYAKQYLSEETSLASPGMEHLRWSTPVRPGDTLSVKVTVLSARRSSSKPDRGVIISDIEVSNQHGETVMSMRPTNLIKCRPPNQ